MHNRGDAETWQPSFAIHKKRGVYSSEGNDAFACTKEIAMRPHLSLDLHNVPASDQPDIGPGDRKGSTSYRAGYVL